MKDNHIVIQKAKIKVYTDSKKSAYDWKDNAPDFLKNVVFQMIENYLNKYEMNNELHKKMTVFNRLKLNITIPNRDYKSRISGFSVEREIQKQLDVIFNSFISDESNAVMRTHTDDKVSYSEADILQNSFIYFLETGMLPWYCNEELRKYLFTEESMQRLFSDSSFIDRFLNACRNKTTRRRFISQLEDEVILKTLNLLFYSRKTTVEITNGFLVFEHVLFTSLSRKDKTDVLTNILGLWYLSDSEEKIRKVLNGVEKLNSLSNIDRKIIDKQVEFFKSEDFLKKLDQLNFDDVFNENQHTLDQIMVSEKNETNIIEAVPEDETHENIEIITDLIHDNLEAVTIDEDSEERIDLKSEILKEITNSIPEIESQSSKQLNKQLVVNAGLIIIHPFLNTFFSRLGLLSETSKLRDPELCVHLLHYLATGVEQDYEHQLSFEKLLCGIPQEMPIERFIFLTEKMKQEAEEVLKAVLQNWTILRNSGIELLQHEFLKREGLIHSDGKNIQISFERKAQDILIDKLEWTLSFIKLPWLNKVIRVNW